MQGWFVNITKLKQAVRQASNPVLALFKSMHHLCNFKQRSEIGKMLQFFWHALKCSTIVCETLTQPAAPTGPVRPVARDEN